ncbi:MAG TPA: DNA-binding domain-containing protein [Thermoanaerobaculia bacterium]|nr:DNA-binding domain-containing protein [Thermoanaerobaculia bacterium]
MNGLRALQRDVLQDLNGVRGREAAERAFDFSRPPAGGVEDRWHVYAHGYVARLAEALEADYAAVRRVLGPGPFAALAERYVRAFPPRSYDLGRAGDLLPEHLSVDPIAVALPFLPDLARLERAVSEAFVAPDAEPLTWEALLEERPETVAALPLVLTPGVTLLPSRWPVVSLWKTRTEPDEEVEVELERNPETALVFRSGLSVTCARLDAKETAFVAALTDGAATLTMLEARLAPGGGAAEIASLLAVFRSLVERSVFSSVGSTATNRSA